MNLMPHDVVRFSPSTLKSRSFCLDQFAFLKITAVVLLQLGTATLLHDSGWLKILLVAYFFGSFLNHNLFLAIHELSHNLAFSTPVYNRWLGIFANLPTSP